MIIIHRGVNGPPASGVRARARVFNSARAVVQQGDATRAARNRVRSAKSKSRVNQSRAGRAWKGLR